MSDDCMCPHCGKVFKINEICGVVPTHDWPPPCRAVCPGSGQEPRIKPVDKQNPLGKNMLYKDCD